MFGFECEIKKNHATCLASTTVAYSALPRGTEFQEGKSRGTEDRPALEGLPLGNSALGSRASSKVGLIFFSS